MGRSSSTSSRAQVDISVRQRISGIATQTTIDGGTEFAPDKFEPSILDRDWIDHIRDIGPIRVVKTIEEESQFSAAK